MANEAPGAEAHATEVSVRVQTQPELVVSAERSSWTLAAGKAVFEGAVRATRGELSLQCNRLEVIHGEDGHVETAMATGGVEIRRDGWLARGEIASLDQVAGRVVLTGEPRLEEAGNVLVGERIVVSLEGEEVNCERCTLSIGSP
ncbi:MAG: LptA/OstA family protein [Myxococcota bacterium]|nr:LptA/OstA family protein [Myxococcota bacterium]